MVLGSSAAVRKFITHWQSLKTEGLLPRLQDFLAAPHPELQPFVILLDVISAADIHVRLLGTGLVQLTGRELTKTNSLDIYAAHLKKRVGEACVKMITQPCGQITERLINTAGGLLVPATSVALPLATKAGPPCLAAYTNTREPVAAGDSMIVVHDILSSEWIDIGAGVPAKT